MIKTAKLKKGFSVLEIIFAIVILGVIASIAVPKLLSSKNDASLSSIKQDIRTITTSVQSYYIVHNKIEKISDAVSLNSSVWNITDKKIVFSEKNTACVTIELTTEDETNILKVTLNSENIGNICKKLIDDGFTDQIYDLN